MTETPQCLLCEHYNWNKSGSCKAFPEGIPQIILANHFDHKDEYAGDRGIRFKEKPRK